MSDITSIGNALSDLSSRIQSERVNVEEERGALLSELGSVRLMLDNAMGRLTSLEKAIHAVSDGRVSSLTAMIGGNGDPGSGDF
jgi:hypothetical protein